MVKGEDFITLGLSDSIVAVRVAEGEGGVVLAGLSVSTGVSGAGQGFFFCFRLTLGI